MRGGGGDFMANHDLEDLLAVVDARPSLAGDEGSQARLPELLARLRRIAALGLPRHDE